MYVCHGVCTHHAYRLDVQSWFTLHWTWGHIFLITESGQCSAVAGFSRCKPPFSTGAWGIDGLTFRTLKYARHRTGDDQEHLPSDRYAKSCFKMKQMHRLNGAVVHSLKEPTVKLLICFSRQWLQKCVSKSMLCSRHYASTPLHCVLTYKQTIAISHWPSWFESSDQQWR